MKQATALTTLVRAGLCVTSYQTGGISRSRVLAPHPGIVVAQDPMAGRRVRRGHPAWIDISTRGSETSGAVYALGDCGRGVIYEISSDVD